MICGDEINCTIVNVHMILMLKQNTTECRFCSDYFIFTTLNLKCTNRESRREYSNSPRIRTWVLRTC